MMKVLVGYASKYGATDEIAHEIGRVLSNLGLDVTVSQIEATRAGEYDAYVIGSAIYAGNWLKAARQFIEENRAELASSRVWLFSSGPVGRPPKPEGDPEGVAALLDSISPEGHVVFAGKLDKKPLNLIEKAVVAAFRAPEGDYRDWDGVLRWAAMEIGEALISSPAGYEPRTGSVQRGPFA
jgi:menaquinone-dependent protoporphyrinogen oxidase